MQLSLTTKILRVFAFTFLGVFIPGVAGLADTLAKGGDWNAGRTALISLVLAAIAGALRGIVAFLPVFSSDNHIGASKTT
jgi:hypothetical protein